MSDSCKVYTVGNYDVQENGIVRDNTNGGVIVGRLDELATGSHWEETARQYAKNEEFYRNLVIEIGTPFGVAARTSDDGSIQEDVLALKVPELVISLREERDSYQRIAIGIIRSKRETYKNINLQVKEHMVGHSQLEEDIERIEGIVFEAIGWTMAFCCAAVDDGKDIRKIECPEVLEKAITQIGITKLKQQP